MEKRRERDRMFWPDRDRKGVQKLRQTKKRIEGRNQKVSKKSSLEGEEEQAFIHLFQSIKSN